MVIGTNVIRLCKDLCVQQFGTSFFQKGKPDLAWRLAYQCLSQQSRRVSKVVKSSNVKVNASGPRVILPNETTVLWTTLKTRKTNTTTLALLENTPRGITELQVIPTVVNLKMDGSRHSFPVKVHNTSAENVTVKPNEVICHLQQVDLVNEIPEDSHDATDYSKSPAFVDLSTSPLNDEQRNLAEKVLENWKDSVFSQSDNDIGCTTAVKHTIPLHDDVPFKQRHRRIPPSQYDEVRRHLGEMLDCGVIRESHSPYSSPVVLVRKRDGSLRFCIDYRKLNSKTIKDSYALPRIEEALEAMGGSQWFSVLDLKSGYWQIEVDEGDKPKTAFTVGPLGFYECNRMAFGLTNAPATFQRLMEHCLSDINFRKCIVYIDDIIIFSSSFEEHIERLEAVFQRLLDFGLKLKLSKCKFFQKKVKFLGHVISSEGIETDPDKIDAIKTWPVPEGVEQLRTFLGFSGYYRKFVPKYAKIVKPLNELLTLCLKDSNIFRAKSETSWKWSSACQKSFEEIVQILSSPLVLTYPDFDLPFIVNTDASQDGLGATLSQLQKGEEKVIAYASRALRKAEKNYPANKLEFLALKWAITEKFHEYLYGNTFTVRTDNNPLTYVTSSAKLDATGHRWMAALSAYNFKVVYRSGKKNLDADALSRRPHPGEEHEGHLVSPEQFLAISNSAVCQAPYATLVECFCEDEKGLEVMLQCCGVNVVLDSGLGSLSHTELESAQTSDPVVGRAIHYVKMSKRRPNRRELAGESSSVCRLLKEWDRLRLDQGILYRIRKDDSSSCEVAQLVIPEVLKSRAFDGIHGDMGHFGVERTLDLARSRFFWPNMSKDISMMVKRCKPCALQKAPQPKQVAPLVPISSSASLELVCIDYLKLERSTGGYENVLVITDHFTRYAQAIPTLNQTAKTTARVLFNNFIVHYGFPERIHSDQGRNFESDVVRQLCGIAGVKKTRTTPYHPMGNGMCERFNRTLIHMLGTLDEDRKKSWKDCVSPLVHAYNSTKHNSNGFSLFFLMFGIHPRLAIDVLLGTDPNGNNNKTSMSTFVQNLRQRLRRAYDVAAKSSGLASTKFKRNYDRKPLANRIEPGDRVLVKNMTPKGKLENFWESEVYVVKQRPNNDIPVYVVQREDGLGRKRTLHRNQMRPCPFRWEPD